MLGVSTSSFFCVCYWLLWRNLQTRVLPQEFLPVLLWWFNKLSESDKLWINFSKCHFDFSPKLSQLQFGLRSINLSSYSCKSFASVVLSASEFAFIWEGNVAAFHSFLYCVVWLYIALHNWRSMLSNFLIFHTSWGVLRFAAFLLLIDFRNASNLSSVTCPTLMSS